MRKLLTALLLFPAVSALAGPIVGAAETAIVWAPVYVKLEKWFGGWDAIPFYALQLFVLLTLKIVCRKGEWPNIELTRNRPVLKH